MQSIVQFNRRTLASVPAWVREDVWRSPPSVCNYGLPQRVLHLIDKPISADVVTEADMLCMFMTELASVQYLEIGVSVGKTFYQLLMFARAHVPVFTMSCLDIEKVNPTLAQLLGDSPETRGRKTSWDNVAYYTADEFDPTIWDEMAGSRFNLVFSDAMHAADALLEEYARVKPLLDPAGFFYCFDDLEPDEVGGAMWGAVRQIHADVVAAFPAASLHHLRIHGWLGEHEHVHHFGVIRCAGDAPAAHFITYADAAPWTEAADCLARSARAGGFATATVCGPDCMDEQFAALNREVLAQPRGAGCWLWKPYVILQKLLQLQEGAVLVYCDSMYMFTGDARDFVEGLLAASPIGLVTNKPMDAEYPERAYTKADAYVLMGVPAADGPQAWAGFVALRKCEQSVRFVAQWLAHCQDPRLVTDAPSTLAAEPPEFQEHRHDQSVLHLLARKWGVRAHAVPDDAPLRCLRPLGDRWP